MSRQELLKTYQRLLARARPRGQEDAGTTAQERAGIQSVEVGARVTMSGEIRCHARDMNNAELSSINLEVLAVPALGDVTELQERAE